MCCLVFLIFEFYRSAVMLYAIMAPCHHYVPEIISWCGSCWVSFTFTAPQCPLLEIHHSVCISSLVHKHLDCSVFAIMNSFVLSKLVCVSRNTMTKSFSGLCNSEWSFWATRFSTIAWNFIPLVVVSVYKASSRGWEFLPNHSFINTAYYQNSKCLPIKRI